jgi:Tfp pilus assembly protein PilF
VRAFTRRSRREVFTIEGNSNPAATPGSEPLPFVRRKVILRDSLTFFVLVLSVIVLFAITAFLFNSFNQRRAALARQYGAIGEAALRQNHPDQAITALRTALSYAPDDPNSRLLLAEALAQAHHTDEAINYFLGLRDLQPADGFINLQLARLARQKKDPRQAIEYYRDSTLGNWQGESLAERREVQLELADYLLQNKDLQAARAELLVAAADQPETTGMDTFFGDKLQQAGDSVDAFRFYQKAVELDPRNTTALFKTGRLAYQMGDYATADRFLTLALRNRREPQPKDDLDSTNSDLAAPDLDELHSLAENSQHLEQLSLSKDLPALERAEHLHTAGAIARRRLADCAAHFANSSLPPQPLQSLQLQWQSATNTVESHESFEDPANEDTLMHLIFDTEIQTSQLCGLPTGDDALLLLLAKSQGSAQ